MGQYEHAFLKVFILAALLLGASLAQAQDVAATAISVRGLVTATNEAGDVRNLKRGDSVYSGDQIETGRRARLRLSFTDGSTSVLKADTTFEITDYNFSGQEDGTERASFNLVQGALEMLSGIIGTNNQNSFQLNTPIATIGLRGTEYVVAVYPPNTPNGPPTIRVSVVGGAIVYSSPGAPAIAVNQGNSITQTQGAQPQAQNTIVEPLLTVTVEGDDVEDAIDQLFEPEVTTEEEAREAEGRNEEIEETEEEFFLEETLGTTEEPVEEPTVEDLATDLRETGEEAPSSVPEPELIEPIIEDLRDQGGLTDEQIDEVAEALRNLVEDTGGCPDGQVVSPSAPGGCAPR